MEEQVLRDIKIGAGIFRLYKRSNGTYRSECIYMPKIPASTCVKDTTPRVVAKFESKTKPGTYHYVTFFPGTKELKCSCYGFRSKDKCWHYRKAMEDSVIDDESRYVEDD